MTRVLLLLSVLPLAACSGGIGFGGGLFGGRDRVDPAPIGAEPAAGTAVAAEGEPEPVGEGQFLGYSVASLGDATVAGLWLETPLVTVEGPGRVVAENGRQITVTLRPSGGERGAGSRLSLAGFQALGLDLTSLPTLTVISDA